jgi:hypothetical protein
MKMHARAHINYCIEALRMSIMCHGDVTPYLLKTDPNSPSGVDPDFSMHHKCVNFWALVDYMSNASFVVKSHNPHKEEEIRGEAEGREEGE